MEEKSFRISTTPGGEDGNIIVNLTQNYDCLDILSLRIQQDKIYRTFSSDYGVLVGRVIGNEGLGLPNAKISVFVPISADDLSNPIISQIYPFTTITDKTAEGVRYNLITPKNVAAGTFPTKQQFLDDDNYLEVYEKYYKYSTVTNSSGDYMIFGVPIGEQFVHMDVDLSDIGQYSTTADIMVANGLSPNLFAASGTNYTFKGGTNLEQLPQINSQTLSANIIPLWGDPNDNTQLGITRLDFKVNLLVSPVAYLTFAIGYDTQHLSDGIYDGSGDHMNPGNAGLFGGTTFPGYLGRLVANNQALEIKAYKYDENGNQLTYDATNFKIVSSGTDILQGIYMVILPCDNDKVITDEYGNTIPSTNGNGIGTTGTWSIEIISNNGAGISNFLLQKNGGNGNETFKLKSNNIYSVKSQFFDAYNLRDDNGRNVYYSNNEDAIFNQGDWVNGFLYFGYGHFDKSGSDYPGWLQFQNNWYNVETRVINVTSYLDTLINGGIPYFNGSTNFNIKIFNDNDILPSVVNNLINDDTIFGNSFSSYEPSRATFYNNGFVFFKGINIGEDCFASIKKYIG